MCGRGGLKSSRTCKIVLSVVMNAVSKFSITHRKSDRITFNCALGSDEAELIFQGKPTFIT